MSMHSSFRSGSGLAKHRNVLSRAERIRILRDQGRWDEEKGIFHLPKVRSIKPK